MLCLMVFVSFSCCGNSGFHLEATDEANEFVERLVHVHPVLGGTLDERGLQLLRHVFAVRCRHLKAISSELYSMQRIFWVVNRN